MITVVNFEKIAIENCVILLKEKQKKILEARTKFQEERARMEKRMKQAKAIIKMIFQYIRILYTLFVKIIIKNLMFLYI